MTAVVNKLQRMLGLRLPEQLAPFCQLPEELRPLVLITHMEHHSNQTSWLETRGHRGGGPARRARPGRPRRAGGAARAVPRAAPEDRRLHRLLQRHRGAHRRCTRLPGSCTATAATASSTTPRRLPTSTSTCTPATRWSTSTRSTSRRTSSSAAPGRRGCWSSTRGCTTTACPTSPAAGPSTGPIPGSEHSFVDGIEAREDGGTPGSSRPSRPRWRCS